MWRGRGCVVAKFAWCVHVVGDLTSRSTALNPHTLPCPARCLGLRRLHPRRRLLPRKRRRSRPRKRWVGMWVWSIRVLCHSLAVCRASATDSHTASGRPLPAAMCRPPRRRNRRVLLFVRAPRPPTPWFIANHPLPRRTHGLSPQFDSEAWTRTKRTSPLSSPSVARQAREGRGLFLR